MLKLGPIRALGTMSGTSLDGVDAAVLVTDGEKIYEFGPSDFRPYTPGESDVIRAALGKWDEVDDAAEVVETAHAQILSRFDPCDLIGFHGQTVAHDPAGRGTLQIGDGAILAEVLNTPVAWDFRSADVRLGGQGAPLAPFYHFALAKYLGATAPVMFLNLGGVGNLTWIDPAKSAPEEDGALVAFDTGPANAPINDYMLTHFGQAYDDNGAVARKGNVDDDVLGKFLSHSYFYKMPPKSLDRDDFAVLTDWIAPLAPNDAVATLTACCAMAVVQGMDHCPSKPSAVYVTGGGRKNATLMDMLTAGLDCPVLPVEDVGLDGDMLEAQAFAYLAVRVAHGLPTSCPATTGVRAAIGGGTISRPTGN
ncbi:anhydro-N-acetylmuramic acid kinase [Marivivens niveibacter]|uniref:Anhydro-N-acetylmuramic acid kinase n=1 Tax=Marivivens niveibacter TaxID=1930667 RepID=A0A251X2S2_9RHOB|nr:anhydro-N-acetylmuramic acid kinase [Marivivens niveibacter]OUD10906.1 anhydro-N-acetylmuramic acid kinase [Marivivens niveibacter]